MSSILDRQFAPLQTSLDLRAYRQQLLAGNMANADTPNYKAVDVDFSAALNSALAGQGGQMPLAQDQSGQQQAAAAAQPASAFTGYETGNQVRLDGNSVDMDREQSAFAKNSLSYEADLTFLSGRIKTLTSAITG